MAVALSMSDIQTVSPIDALWTLFKSQPKSIRKAFTERLLREDVEAETMRQKVMLKESVTRAFCELREAQQTGRELPNARDLFK